MQLRAQVRGDEVRYVRRVERRRDLCVEVDAIYDDDDCRIAQRGVQAEFLGDEHHEQRLAGALEVPDEAFADSAFYHAFHDLVRGLVLLKARDQLDLAVLGVGGE